MTDGDGIRVAGHEIRIAGIDAPEWNQKAKHRNGYWFNHGKRMKDALIKKVGGRHVHISVEGEDRFGRLLGTETYKGVGIGEWLAQDGMRLQPIVIAIYKVEKPARNARHVGTCP